MAQTWTVVSFVNEGTVEAVPTSWIHKNECLWPPLTKDKLQKAIQNGDVDTHWPSHKISIFKDATFSDYYTARRKSQKAEKTNDLSSDVDLGKKRNAKKKYSSSESEPEEYRGYQKLATPPKKKSRSLHLGSKTPMKENILTEVNKNLNPSPPYQDQDSVASRPSTVASRPSQPYQDSVASHPSPVASHPSPVASYPSQPYHDSVASRPSSSNNACNHSCKHCCTKKRPDKNLLFVIKDICCDILSKVEMQRSPDPVSDENILGQVGVDYPMENITEMTAFEDFFRDKDKHKALVQYFYKTGGSTTGDFVRRCLAPIISNKLGGKYSFFGRKQKENFSILSVSKALVEAADKISSIKDRKEIEAAISCWLKRSKAREETERKN